MTHLNKNSRFRLLISIVSISVTCMSFLESGQCEVCKLNSGRVGTGSHCRILVCWIELGSMDKESIINVSRLHYIKENQIEYVLKRTPVVVLTNACDSDAVDLFDDDDDEMMTMRRRLVRT